MADDRDFKMEDPNPSINFRGGNVLPKYIYDEMSDYRKESWEIDCILRQLKNIPLEKLKKLLSYELIKDEESVRLRTSIWI